MFSAECQSEVEVCTAVQNTMLPASDLSSGLVLQRLWVALFMSGNAISNTITAPLPCLGFTRVAISSEPKRERCTDSSPQTAESAQEKQVSCCAQVRPVQIAA